MKKIAYLILAHNDSAHIKRLVDKLDYNADFYIHIDKKADLNDFKINRKNIHFIPDRQDVFWAGFNMIEATKRLLETAVTSKNQYKRLVLLSGADYPLVSNEEIHMFFENNKDTEFIRGFNVTKTKNKHYLKQIQNYHFRDVMIINKLVTKVLRKAASMFTLKKPYIKTKTDKLDVYFGSQWWAITPNCAAEMLKIIKNNKEIDNYFKYSFAPDEKYFHTVFFNSSFKNKTVENGVGEFDGRGTFKWANIHHIHPSLSKWYSVDEKEEVLASPKLFIRKVRSGQSKELLDIIDERIQQKIHA